MSVDIFNLLSKLNPLLWQEFEVQESKNEVIIKNYYYNNSVELYGLDTVKEHPEVKRLLENYKSII